MYNYYIQCTCTLTIILCCVNVCLKYNCTTYSVPILSYSVNYTVKTKNNYGNALSTLSTVTTRVSLPEPPANVFVPADTVATDSVSLRWTENTAGSNDITGYSIYVNGVKVHVQCICILY